MAIVARGLGQPEDGALVAGGLGTSETNPNAMVATITATGTLTGTLTADSPAPTTPGHIPPGRLHPGVLTMPQQPVDEYDERLVLVLALT